MGRYRRLIWFFVAAGLAGCAGAPPDDATMRNIGPRIVTIDAPRTADGTARLAAADLADGATTAIGLAQPGIVEANPLMSWAGPAAPVVGLAGKYAIKSALIEGGLSPAEANRSVETGSAFAACANVATIAGAAAPPALIAGLLCGAAYHEASRPQRYVLVDRPGAPHLRVPDDYLD